MQRNFAVIVILNIVLLFVLAGGIYVLLNHHQSVPASVLGPSKSTNGTTTATAQPQLPVINPNSQTASKYFAGQSDAIDFRDGAMGDFATSITKTGNGLQLNYDTSIKAFAVRVWDVGRLDVLTDHQMIYSISYGDAKTIANANANNTKPATPPPMPATPGPVVLPTSFLPNPYHIGQVPDNYHADAILPGMPTQSPQAAPSFQTDKRYSIEIDGFDAKNAIKHASYTFTY